MACGLVMVMHMAHVWTRFQILFPFNNGAILTKIHPTWNNLRSIQVRFEKVFTLVYIDLSSYSRVHIHIFYTGDFCCDLSPFDACDYMDWLTSVLDHLCPSYINQYFCDSTTQSHASEREKSPQKSLDSHWSSTPLVWSYIYRGRSYIL